uniref:Uncharacterized protein n=1 Tax=Magallana gigas TaxID=29159 RepID=A0A8W8N390_MAGGI
MGQFIQSYPSSVVLVVCLVNVVYTDDAVCSRLNESMRNVCYQNSVYRRCKQTCKGLLLADNGNKKYKDMLCPWGNYDNIRDSGLDSRCEKKVSGKCSRYCTNPAPGTDLKDGRNCCKACIDLCQKAPGRDSNFREEYPEIYS